MTPVAVSTTPETSADAERTAGALLRTFFGIADRWQLSADEQATLLDVSRATVFRLRQRAQPAKAAVSGLSTSTLERLTVLWEIFKSLRTFFGNQRGYADHRYADQWVRQPNRDPLFGGRPALERLLSGKTIDLYLVRDHVTAMLGVGTW